MVDWLIEDMGMCVFLLVIPSSWRVMPGGEAVIMMKVIAKANTMKCWSGGSFEDLD